MTHPSSDVAEAYVRLAHGIDAHFPGYIDGYGGPTEWSDRSPRPLDDLAQDAAWLEDLIRQEPDPTRRAFLQVQTRAMGTMLRQLSGERLAYADEVRGLYDISPLHTPEETFQAAHTALEGVLPGTGALPERLDALRRRVTVPRDDLLRVAAPILQELRNRAARLTPLPAGEDFSLQLVNDQPWGAYNWPLGNFRSRIDLNTDLPVTLTSLPDLMAHEGYPGHHTEHALKELHLSRERGWQEHSLQLINAPECVVSEGIAMNALHAVMTADELRDWLTGDLSRLAGLDRDDVAAQVSAMSLQQGLEGVNGNAALLLHADGRSEAEVLDYLQTYALSTPERARQSLKFIQSPHARSYVYTYTVGAGLVRQAMAAGQPQDVFRRLLTEPVTPGELAG